METAVQQAATRQREDCLQPQEKERDNTRTPLVVTDHPSLPLLRNITRQHQHLLQLSERMKKAVPTPPIIAYRRPKNLRDLLTRAELKPPPQLVPGNKPCGRPRCKTRPTLMATDMFTSKTSGKSYNMRSSTTCKTANLIYLIQCKKCGCQYVGETEQALNERMNSHRTDIRHKKTEKPVANSRDHTMDDVQVMVIERIWRNDTVLRKIREKRWISTLDTSWPNGMNLRTTAYDMSHNQIVSRLHKLSPYQNHLHVCTVLLWSHTTYHVTYHITNQLLSVLVTYHITNQLLSRLYYKEPCSFVRAFVYLKKATMLKRCVLVSSRDLWQNIVQPIMQFRQTERHTERLVYPP